MKNKSQLKKPGYNFSNPSAIFREFTDCHVCLQFCSIAEIIPAWVKVCNERHLLRCCEVTGWQPTHGSYQVVTTTTTSPSGTSLLATCPATLSDIAWGNTLFRQTAVNLSQLADPLALWCNRGQQPSRFPYMSRHKKLFPGPISPGSYRKQNQKYSH